MKSRGFVIAAVDLVLVVMVAALVGCGDDPTGPQLGTVQVEVTTSGAAIDPDGFVVGLDDGAQTEDIDPSGSVTLEVEAGRVGELLQLCQTARRLQWKDRRYRASRKQSRWARRAAESALCLAAPA